MPQSGTVYADMAELADALDSGSSEFTLMQVQVLLSAPYKNANIDTVSIYVSVLVLYPKILKPYSAEHKKWIIFLSKCIFPFCLLLVVEVSYLQKYYSNYFRISTT